MTRRLFRLAAASVVLWAGFGSASSAEKTKGADALSVIKESRMTVGDWVVACDERVEGKKSCLMTQTLSSARSGKTLSTLSIGKDRTGKLTGSFRFPVGMRLADGVVVDVEDKAFNVAYSTCLRVGCIAPFEFTEALLGQTQKAKKMTATVQNGAQGPLALEFSLRGFSEAYKAYREVAE